VDPIITLCGDNSVTTAAAVVLNPELGVQANMALFALVGGCPRANTSQWGCQQAVQSTCTCLSNVPTTDNTPTDYSGCCPFLPAEVDACLGTEPNNGFFNQLVPQAEITGCPLFPQPLCSASVAALAGCYGAYPPQNVSGNLNFTDTLENCCWMQSAVTTVCTNQDIYNIGKDLGLPVVAFELYEYIQINGMCGPTWNGNDDVVSPQNICGSAYCDYSTVAYGVYAYNGYYVSANRAITTDSFAYSLNGMDYFYLQEGSAIGLAPAPECAV